MPDMLRKDREIPQEEAKLLLHIGEYGFLATADMENNPYVTPLNYVYSNGKIYFHCAQKGHKIDNMKKNENVCFCVTERVEVVPEHFTTKFESVIVFGKAREVTDVKGKEIALLSLIKKYAENHLNTGKDHIRKFFDSVAIWEITPWKISGKAKRKSSAEKD